MMGILMGGPPSGTQGKEPPANAGEGPLEEGMTTHSSIPVWRIPWTEEPGRLQSIGSQSVKTSLKQLRMRAHILMGVR